jgi:ketosteroid isomerase-like protein
MKKMAETVQSEVSGEPASLQAVIRLNEALNAGDVDAMMRQMTEDCVFENTDPPPDGARYAGQAAVRGFWERFFRSSRRPRLETEELFALGDRCILRWVYHWENADGTPGHVRGVDVYRVQDGLILEKLSYVKG